MAATEDTTTGRGGARRWLVIGGVVVTIAVVAAAGLFVRVDDGESSAIATTEGPTEPVAEEDRSGTCAPPTDNADSLTNEDVNAFVDCLQATGGPQVTGSVSFVSPRDGDEVTSPVRVEMEADGVELRNLYAAGPVEFADAMREDIGHLHVHVDVGCSQPGEVISFTSDTHHLVDEPFTTLELDLEPGAHTLCLQYSQSHHVASDLTETIGITVIE